MLVLLHLSDILSRKSNCNLNHNFFNNISFEYNENLDDYIFSFLVIQH